MTHNEAVHSFARSLDTGLWLVYPEPHLANSTDGIPDVLAIRKSYANFEIRVYEIKISDNDLYQDIKKVKFEKYFKIAHRVYFALGPKVSKKAEEFAAQEQVGIVRFKTVWRQKKHAPRVNNKDFPLGYEDYLALLMNGKEMSKEFRRLSRMEVEKQNLLKTEIKEMYNVFRGNLGKKLDEVRTEMNHLENLRDHNVKKARDEIFRTLRVWSVDNTNQDLLEEIMRETFRGFEDNFKKVMKEKFEALDKFKQKKVKKKNEKV